MNRPLARRSAWIVVLLGFLLLPVPASASQIVQVEFTGLGRRDCGHPDLSNRIGPLACLESTFQTDVGVGRLAIDEDGDVTPLAFPFYGFTEEGFVCPGFGGCVVGGASFDLTGQDRHIAGQYRRVINDAIWLAFDRPIKSGIDPIVLGFDVAGNPLPAPYPSGPGYWAHIAGNTPLGFSLQWGTYSLPDLALAAIPAPATLLLLLGGVALIGWRRMAA